MQPMLQPYPLISRMWMGEWNTFIENHHQQCSTHSPSRCFDQYAISGTAPPHPIAYIYTLNMSKNAHYVFVIHGYRNSTIRQSTAIIVLIICHHNLYQEYFRPIKMPSQPSLVLTKSSIAGTFTTWSPNYLAVIVYLAVGLYIIHVVLCNHDIVLWLLKVLKIFCSMLKLLIFMLLSYITLPSYSLTLLIMHTLFTTLDVPVIWEIGLASCQVMMTPYSTWIDKW